jgi:hypothetical protein
MILLKGYWKRVPCCAKATFHGATSAILARLKMGWKLHFVEHGIRGQRRAQVCFVPPV